VNHGNGKGVPACAGTPSLSFGYLRKKLDSCHL
jgi:hypothetical protein